MPYIPGVNNRNTKSGDGICYACGRFAGRADDCPYCEAGMPSGSIRHLCRRWGLWAVLAGMALLWYWAGTQPVRQIRAGEITPRMNYALVRISGEVASKPYVRLEGSDGYISFLLSDGSGVVRVSMDGATAAHFAAEGDVCQKGVPLNITGVLSVKKGQDVRLFVKPLKGDRGWSRAI